MRLRVFVFFACVLAMSVMPGAARAIEDTPELATVPDRRAFAGLLLVTGLWVVALRGARSDPPPRIVIRAIDHVE